MKNGNYILILYRLCQKAFALEYINFWFLRGRFNTKRFESSHWFKYFEYWMRHKIIGLIVFIRQNEAKDNEFQHGTERSTSSTRSGHKAFKTFKQRLDVISRTICMQETSTAILGFQYQRLDLWRETNWSIEAYEKSSQDLIYHPVV